MGVGVNVGGTGVGETGSGVGVRLGASVAVGALVAPSVTVRCGSGVGSSPAGFSRPRR